MSLFNEARIIDDLHRRFKPVSLCGKRFEYPVIYANFDRSIEGAAYLRGAGTALAPISPFDPTPSPNSVTSTG
jgi:hypothetical protein